MKSKNRSVVRPEAYYNPTPKQPTQRQIEYYDGLLAVIKANGLGDGSTFSKKDAHLINQSIKLMKAILRKNNINSFTGEKMKPGDTGFVRAYSLYSYVHVCYCVNCEYYDEKVKPTPRNGNNGMGICRRLAAIGEVKVRDTDFCSKGTAREEEAEE